MSQSRKWRWWQISWRSFTALAIGFLFGQQWHSCDDRQELKERIEVLEAHHD
jgi:hypothetical protein